MVMAAVYYTSIIYPVPLYYIYVHTVILAEFDVYKHDYTKYNSGSFLRPGVLIVSAQKS